jgi:hypothetical protein
MPSAIRHPQHMCRNRFISCCPQCRGGPRRGEQSARWRFLSGSLLLRSVLLFSLEPLLSLLNLRPPQRWRQFCYLPTEPCDNNQRMQN